MLLTISISLSKEQGSTIPECFFFDKIFSDFFIENPLKQVLDRDWQPIVKRVINFLNTLVEMEIVPQLAILC